MNLPSNANNKELNSYSLATFSKSNIMIMRKNMYIMLDFCNIYVTFVKYRAYGVRYVF